MTRVNRIKGGQLGIKEHIKIVLIMIGVLFGIPTALALMISWCKYLWRVLE